MIQTKAQIVDALDNAFEEVAVLVESLSDDAFTSAPSGKWSPGMQADHLVRAARPVNLALRLPRFGLRLAFGKPIRPHRRYDETIAKYRAALDAGAVATGPYVPPDVPASRRGKVVKALHREKKRFKTVLEEWREPDLDHYLLPHPLIGKLTVREILFFTVYHTQFHGNSIQELTR